jgi:hypothetical protein
MSWSATMTDRREEREWPETLCADNPHVYYAVRKIRRLGATAITKTLGIDRASVRRVFEARKMAVLNLLLAPLLYEVVSVVRTAKNCCCRKNKFKCCRNCKSVVHVRAIFPSIDCRGGRPL